MILQKRSVIWYLSKRNIIFNFIFIFLIPFFISYVALIKIFALSFQVSSVGALSFGYSMLMQIRLCAKILKYNDEKIY